MKFNCGLPPSPILRHDDASKDDEYSAQYSDKRERMSTILHMHPERHLYEYLQESRSHQDDVDEVFVDFSADYCRECDKRKREGENKGDDVFLRSFDLMTFGAFLCG